MLCGWYWASHADTVLALTLRHLVRLLRCCSAANDLILWTKCGKAAVLDDADEIARGDLEILKPIADVLDTVSATCAVADKARILGLIARMKSRYPDLVAHADVIEPELRAQRSEVA